MRVRAFVLLALVALFYAAASASAASSIFPSHEKNAIIAPRANAYRSRFTLMPLNYYRVGVCSVSHDQRNRDKANEDLGEILTGNRLVPTPFEFKVTEDENCKRLCTTKFTEKDIRVAKYLIENRYDVRMFLDGVPLVSSKGEMHSGSYREGYSFGPLPSAATAAGAGQLRIHNHLSFTIRYAVSTMGRYDIVGFSVEPRSVDKVMSCDATSTPTFSQEAKTIPFPKKKVGVEIEYTYSVRWEESEEPYVIARSNSESEQKRGHRIAALYGVLLTVLAGVVVAFVMLRTVRKDLAMYLDDELNDAELREESGWKLVRGDVFRSPPYPIVLATLIGAGSQIAVTVLVTMLLCATKMVNPAIRGRFLTAIITVFLFTHVVSGFATSRLLKLFGMGSWQKAVLCMAAFPLSLGGGLLTLNLLHWMKHTTAAIPFGTIFVMLLLWVVVSLPFGVAGVFAGYRMDTLAVTAKVSSIPRLIPAEAGCRTIYYAAFGSFVPFVACCVEVTYVLNAFWREESMYMFGLLTFFLCTVGVLCLEVGIVVTYFTLRAEDYRWWWRSFGTLAATGVYLFCYSVFFLMYYLEIRLFTSVILFLAYMMGVSIMFGCALGTISFIGSFWLVQRMYGAIKAE